MTSPSHDDVYITYSNFSKAVHSVLVMIRCGIEQIYQNAYQPRDLRQYINHEEAKEIEQRRLFLEGTEEYIKSFLQNRAALDLAETENAKASHYVFISTSRPKFHSNRHCEMLTRDYVNFVIPQEIRARGQSEVEQFRAFASENRKLVSDGREDVFIQKLKNRFGLQSSMSKISYTNSGAREFVFYDSADIAAQKIDETLSEIDSLGSSPEGAAALKRFRFLHYRNTRQVGDNPIGLKLLILKRKLIDQIIAYHMARSAKNGFSLNRSFLETLGFEPCKSCCEGFDLSAVQQAAAARLS